MAYRVVTAFFQGRVQADGALQQLSTVGVAPDDVSFILKVVRRRDDLGLRTGTKALEGAAIGGLAGGLVGGIAGSFAAGASLVVPMLHLVLAGPTVSAAAGAGTLGAAGVLVGALLGARRAAYEARYLPDAVVGGGSLISVRCRDDRAEVIRRLLESCGARRVQTVRVR